MKILPEILVIGVEWECKTSCIYFSDFGISKFYTFFFFLCRRKIHPDQKNINAYVVFKDESAATKALER